MRTVADLHPEALLDRAARNEITPSERTRLDAHLERCTACRFELQLRSDFADDLLSDVTPSSVELLLAGSSSAGASKAVSSNPASNAGAAAVVPTQATSVPEPTEVIAPQVHAAETLGAVVSPSANSAAKKSIAPLPARRRRVSHATWLLVAAAVFGVSAAGASSAGQRVLSRLLGEPSAAIPADDEAPLPQHVAAKHVSRHRTAPVPTAASAATEASREPPTTLDVLLTSTGTNVTPPVETLARRAAPSSPDGAPFLFEAATDARRRGDYARAVVLQRELVSRYPQSREAHVSRATGGRLLLDRGDPRGALSSFDAYLAGGSGELGEEAMVGRATALERLGRTSEAVGAWQALLAAYPETAYAAHARSRLGSMSVR